MAITKSIGEVEVTFSVTDDNNVTRSDVITTALYCCEVTSGNRTFANHEWVTLSTSDLSTFTDYDSLTQASVITMCENTIGSSAVTAIEESLNAQKAEHETPTKEVRTLA